MTESIKRGLVIGVAIIVASLAAMQMFLSAHPNPYTQCVDIRRELVRTFYEEDNRRAGRSIAVLMAEQEVGITNNCLHVFGSPEVTLRGRIDSDLSGDVGVGLRGQIGTSVDGHMNLDTYEQNFR